MLPVIAIVCAAFAVAAIAYALVPKANPERFWSPEKDKKSMGRWFAYWADLSVAAGQKYPADSKTPGLVAVLAGVGGALLGYFLLPAISPVTALGGVFFLRAFLKRGAKKSREKLNEQLPDFLFALASALRRGLTLESSIRDVTKVTAEPLGSTLRKLDMDIKQGVPFDEALMRWANESPSRTVGLVAANLSMTHASGGTVDLERDVTNLGHRVAEENGMMKLQISKQTQARLVGRILYAMGPAGLALTYYAFGPGAFQGAAVVIVPTMSLLLTGFVWWAVSSLEKWQFANAGEIG